MIGRNIARKVTRNLTHPIGLGWSLGTAPDGGPGPVAVITPDSQILPTFYTEGNGYFPAQTDLLTYRGYTYHGVFFSGWGSTTAFNIVKYEWDFGAGTEGDEGGRYFEGINAGHVFETAGTYNVTLTVTDFLGRTSSATRTVRIYARGAGSYSMRHYGASDEIGALVGYDYALKTYYVDAVSGNDANDGLTTGTAWQTWAKVMTAMTKTNGSAVTSWTLKPGDQVLFKRGQTFNFSAEKNFSHGGMSQGIHFGAYGTGAKPLIQWVTPAGASAWQPNHTYAVNDKFYLNDINGQFGRMRNVNTGYTSGSVWKQTEGQNIDNLVAIKTGSGGGFLSITDIDFSFADGTTSLIDGTWSAVNNTRNGVYLRCTFNDPYNSAIGWNTTAAAPNTTQPYGMFIHGCSANQNNVSRSAVVLLIYGQYNALSMIGNSADKSGNHINYLETVQYAVIADNTFSRPGFGRTALRITGHDIAAGLEAKFIHVTRNNFLGWVDDQNGDNIIPEELGPGGAVHNGGGNQYNFTLINLCPNSGLGKDGTDIVFDRNFVSNYKLGVAVTNRKRVKLANNVFVSPSPDAIAIKIGESSAGAQDFACEDIKIWQNTFVQTGNVSPVANNPVIRVNGTSGVGDGHGYHTGVSIEGNLAISVAGRTDVLVGFQYGNTYGQITNMTQDYNLLDASSTNWCRDILAGVTYNVADWRTAFSKDIHSLKTAATVVTAPTATSHAPGFPSTLAAGLAEVVSYKTALHLQSSSAAIDAGGTENVLTDILSVQRPVGSANDIGAFESLGAGGGSVISLPQQANLVAQWSADSISQANGSSVASWTDSISGIVASQATGANQPTFQTNIYGGKPSVRFNGSSHKLDIATPGALKTAVDSQTFTVMIAFKQLSNTGGGFGSLLTYKDGGANTRYYIADNSRLHRYPMKSSGASIPFGATYLNTFATFGNTSGNGPRGAGLERAYVNGGCVYAETSKAPGGNTSQWMIGSNVGGTFYVNADIFEILVWNVELTPAEVKQYQSWVCNKYSQTVPWAGLTYYTVFDGDSLTMGSGETGSVSGIYPYKSAASLGLTYGQWDNLGIGSQLISEMTTKFSTDVSPIATQTGKPLKIAAFEWYNQRLDADPVGKSTSYLTAARASGAKVAFGTSTDSGITPETARDSYNAYFDANHGSGVMDSYAAIHSSTLIGVEGANVTNPTYFSADKIHLVALGYTELASYMTTALSAIP